MDEEVIDGNDAAGKDLSGDGKENAERDEVRTAQVVWKHEEGSYCAEEGTDLELKCWLAAERGRLPRASVWRSGTSER